MKAARRQKNLRLPESLLTDLARFCELTRRSESDVIRAAIELLLAGGFAEAEKRLTAGLRAAAGSAGPAPRRGRGSPIAGGAAGLLLAGIASELALQFSSGFW